jgi:hypothetical protein
VGGKNPMGPIRVGSRPSPIKEMYVGRSLELKVKEKMPEVVIS